MKNRYSNTKILYNVIIWENPTQLSSRSQNKASLKVKTCHLNYYF